MNLGLPPVRVPGSLVSFSSSTPPLYSHCATDPESFYAPGNRRDQQPRSVNDQSTSDDIITPIIDSRSSDNSRGLSPFNPIHGDHILIPKSSPGCFSGAKHLQVLTFKKTPGSRHFHLGANKPLVSYGTSPQAPGLMGYGVARIDPHPSSTSRSSALGPTRGRREALRLNSWVGCRRRWAGQGFSPTGSTSGE